MYNDKLLRFLTIPLMSLIMVLLRRDVVWWGLLKNKDNFYMDFFFSLLLTAVIWQVCRAIIIKLDFYYNWDADFFIRFLIQSTSTIVIATTLMFLFSYLYSIILNIQVGYIFSLNIEFPAGILMTVIINLLYFLLYRVGIRDNNQLNLITNEKRIIVKLGKKNIPLYLNDVAYFFYSNKLVFLATLDDKKEFYIDISLNEIEKNLMPKTFFRINRKVVVNILAIKSFQSTKTRRLLIKLSPSFNQEEIFVSQKKAVEFKKWFKKCN